MPVQHLSICTDDSKYTVYIRHSRVLHALMEPVAQDTLAIRQSRNAPVVESQTIMVDACILATISEGIKELRCTHLNVIRLLNIALHLSSFCSLFRKVETRLLNARFRTESVSNKLDQHCGDTLLFLQIEFLV